MNQILEKSRIIGIHTFRKYDTTSPEAHALEQQIEQLIADRHLWNPVAYQAKYKELYNKMKQYMTEEKVIKNLITTRGRSVLAQRLANDTTYTGIINYGALGSSSTAVTNADTQLNTEVFRKVVASTSTTNNIAFIDFFYSKTDTNGTYEEFGTFIDGTGTVNTGRIFTHALTGGWTKSSSESMTVACQYTFT